MIHQALQKMNSFNDLRTYEPHDSYESYELESKVRKARNFYETLGVKPSAAAKDTWPAVLFDKELSLRSNIYYITYFPAVCHMAGRLRRLFDIVVRTFETLTVRSHYAFIQTRLGRRAMFLQS